MMTEWGGDGCGGSDARKQEECSHVQDLADRHLQSWALWGMFNDQDFADGALSPQKSDVLSRTYAQAVAGNVVNMTFDKASRAFQLCYELDTSIDEPTVIYIAAAIFYKDAPVITTTANIIAHVRYRYRLPRASRSSYSPHFRSNNTVLVTPVSLNLSFANTSLACVHIMPPAARSPFTH